jgi:hypothetical protein
MYEYDIYKGFSFYFNLEGYDSSEIGNICKSLDEGDSYVYVGDP